MRTMTRKWKRSAVAAKPINVVVDLSHPNENVDFVKMKADGIVAVIHKATQGLTYVDETYATRQKAASKVDCYGARITSALAAMDRTRPSSFSIRSSRTSRRFWSSTTSLV